jgi:hypothetical protein
MPELCFIIFISHYSKLVGRENQVHERVEGLKNLSQFSEVFQTNKSKAATIAKFQDWVQQVH